MRDETLRAVAARHGTPTYVYDLETISRRLREIRAREDSLEMTTREFREPLCLDGLRPLHARLHGHQT